MSNKSVWVMGLVFVAVYISLLFFQNVWVNWMLGDVRGAHVMAELSYEVHQVAIAYAILALCLPSQACLTLGDGDTELLRYTNRSEMFTSCLVMSLGVPFVVGDYLFEMARVGLMEFVYFAAIAVTYLGALVIKKMQFSQEKLPSGGNYWRLKLIEIT